MYYLNSFLLYSFLGFTMESTLFKNTNTLRTSGVLHGPIAIEYGIGALAIILIQKYVIDKLKIDKYLKVIIAFFIFSVVLTLIEGATGYLFEFIFGIEKWNYLDMPYHLGKYITLLYSPIWGILGVIIGYLSKSFFSKIIKLIPKEITYLFTIFLSLDTIITIITK